MLPALPKVGTGTGPGVRACTSKSGSRPGSIRAWLPDLFFWKKPKWVVRFTDASGKPRQHLNHLIKEGHKDTGRARNTHVKKNVARNGRMSGHVQRTVQQGAWRTKWAAGMEPLAP